MIIIDWEKVQEHFDFLIKSYGTRTQGEDFRRGQVAAKIRADVVGLLEAYEALKEHTEATDSIIVLSVK